MAKQTFTVTCVKRSENGSISHLGNARETHSLATARRNIERGELSYRVGSFLGPEVQVVTQTNGDWYLRSDPDDETCNNLGDLQECP
ncbi:DUF3892 domain-containing protein [Pseudenhygromyxa sp. WMMC2535]|uniref:DUF3892 domain-containing protein n=1 Tax=Pseudenhygromyxa sp. WMMC2535 TaxID=2712867 RepID=UPI001553418A|nr:DUF3892 domain-containing protein [Pseudenhygromyxa sp. WMMC2535]NVB40361.1 DUF3892 domain-containing protein [Pseudenhygromyxa sp. WMMC2535]